MATPRSFRWNGVCATAGAGALLAARSTSRRRTASEPCWAAGLTSADRRAQVAERLLHIKASPRGSLSRSAMVASRLLARLQETDVEPLDLFDADLPPFGGAVIEGRYALLSGQPVAGDAAGDWQRIEGMGERKSGGW